MAGAFFEDFEPEKAPVIPCVRVKNLLSFFATGIHVRNGIYVFPGYVAQCLYQVFYLLKNRIVGANAQTIAQLFSAIQPVINLRFSRCPSLVFQPSTP